MYVVFCAFELQYIRVLLGNANSCICFSSFEFNLISARVPKIRGRGEPAIAQNECVLMISEVGEVRAK